MAEDRQQLVLEEEDGDVNMTDMDNEDPVDTKLIKIYSSIDKLNEDNARYWFHAIQKQLRTQYAWQAIEPHVRIGNEAHAERLVRKPNWRRVEMQADMIIEMGLASATTLEVKDQRNVGENWSLNTWVSKFCCLRSTWA